MGYWFPTFKVVGGLYAGQTPSGNLDAFIAHIPNFISGASTVVGSNTIQYDSAHPQVIPEWVGAYGSDDSGMISYGEEHIGEGLIQDVPIFIFEIPAPENATFYKQELVVYGSVRCDERQSGDPIHQPTTWYKRHDFSFSVITKAVRREYATPYAEPVVTHTLFTGNAGFGGINYLEGGNSSNAGRLERDFRTGVSYATINDIDYLCFFLYVEDANEHGLYDPTDQSWETSYFYKYTLGGISYNSLAAAFGGDFSLDEDDDPNIDPDDPGEPGDNPPPEPGPKEKEYDPVPIPPKPTVTALGAGFLSLYSPSATLLNLFASEMYSDNILDIIHNYFTNVADMIAGLAIVPFFVPITGFSKHRVGLFRTSMAFPIVADQFIDVDCGSIEVKHYYNSFLDYAPNSKLYLYLPYIGYQELNADEVMGQTLSVKYRCDILSGACVAFVMIGSGSDPSYNVGRVIAQFTGNCITQVPAAAASYDSMVSSAINILTGAVGIAAGGAIGAAGAGAAAGAAKAPSATAGAVGAQVGLGVAGTASNIIMGMKPTVARNGTPGSTAGYMSVQKPYLIKIVPRSAIAPNHIQLQGYPSNYGGTLASLTGYCEVQEIQLNIDPNGTAPEVDEKTEIYRLLKGGVVI